MASNQTPKSGKTLSEIARERKLREQRQRMAARRQNIAGSQNNAKTGSRRTPSQNAAVSGQKHTGSERTAWKITSQDSYISNKNNGPGNYNTGHSGSASGTNPNKKNKTGLAKRSADQPSQSRRNGTPSAAQSTQNRRAGASSAVKGSQNRRTGSPSAAQKKQSGGNRTKKTAAKRKNYGRNAGGGTIALSPFRPVAALQIYMSHWHEYTFKKKALSILIAAAILMMIVFIIFSIVEIATTPQLDLDNFTYIQGTQIMDKNGAAYQNLETEEYREIVTIDQIPKHVQNAFVDIEDQRFYSHHGVDFKGLARAVISAIFSGSLDGPGGSTITQQLIKQTHLSSEKTINRKYHEIVLALRLEREYTKDQILESYLNKINLSQAWGIQAAAKTYFGVDVGNLSLAQAAMLAAMPKSPSYYDPYVYDDDGNIVKEADGRCALSEENKERAIIVLDKMLELKHITQEERDQAAAQIEANNVGLTYNPHTNTYSYFTEALYDEVLNDLMEQKLMTEDQATSYLLNGGLIIYSTVDQEVQTAMETAAKDDSLFPEQSDTAAAASAAISADEGETINYTPEVAMTVIDNATGGVAGMVGGRNKDSNLTMNRATQRFQPGSSTKPLTTYGPGIDTHAITLATMYDDVAISYYGWQPTNSGGGYSGRISVRQGITQSLNTIAVQACIATGLETCASYAEKVGLYINREDQLDVNPASLALGGYSEGQSTLAMASAYSSFVNGGVHKSYSFYTKVTDSKGNVILQEETTETQVYSAQTAYLITDVLQQAVHGGTTTINCEQPVAGKTGTTDDERHAWICGYTPYYSMAVWYGYDENYVETSQGNFELNIDLTGGSKPGPASMFEEVMSAINDNKESASFASNPGGITTATIDTISGKLATNLSTAAGHVKTEMFIDGTVPTESDDSHYTANVCSVSGKLAGAYCPANCVTQSVFYKSPSLFPTGITGNATGSNLAPTETCTVHTATSTQTTTQNNNSTNTGQNSATGTLNSDWWKELINSQ